MKTSRTADSSREIGGAVTAWIVRIISEIGFDPGL
jgi:hypothetical protein